MGIKSEKAKEFIEDEYFENSIMGFTSVKIFSRKAVEISEKEMMARAVDAHRNLCDSLSEFKVCNRIGFEPSECCDECGYMQDFINELNK